MITPALDVLLCLLLPAAAIAQVAPGQESAAVAQADVDKSPASQDNPALPMLPAETKAVADPADPIAAPAVLLEHEPAGPESVITRVVVFPKHAEVTREITVDAEAGENQVTFTSLVPILNPHTLRASISAGARITGTELRTAYLKESLADEIAVLDAQVQGLSDDLAAEQRAKGRLAEQAAFYSGVKGRLAEDMGRELAAGGVSVGDWKQVLGFVTDGLTECDTQLAALEQRVRDKQQHLDALQNQRKDYSSRQPREMKEVAVSFTADSPGPRQVELHYMVDTVVWQPSYDVRLDREAGRIELTGYGQIVQWSGEHWKDVQLTLAMSRPDFELALPELTPMQASLDDKEMADLAKQVSYLSRLTVGDVQKWAEGHFKRSQERETFRRNLEQLSRRPNQLLEKYGLSQEIIESAMSRLVDRFAGVRYEIPQRESIPYNSSPHKVVAFTASVPAQLKYVATPALGKSIMLEAAVVNTSDFPIIAGGASLFIDDSYVGAGAVTSAAKNEPLTFGFGPDDSLVVNRRLLARDVKGPEAFRQSQVITYNYEIAVQNFNQRSVEVEVADQIPISKTADIQVNFLEAGPQAQLDAQTGTLRWAIEIGAGATGTISYSFSVECPVGRDVHWE